MRLADLVEGRLIRRRNRFVADVELLDGSRVTAHCPNTGSLLGVTTPGRPVWIRDSKNPERTHRYSWVLAKPGRALVCVDTGVPNRVVTDFARAQKIPELAGFHEYKQEVPYGKNSRIDLLCRVHRDDMLRRVWVEVKSTTLARDRVAQFPDAVTTRGRKHLVEMAKVVAAGDEALQLYFIQRGDCDVFRPADDIDPEYGKELRHAAKAGVKILALEARITKQSITIKRPIPVEL